MRRYAQYQESEQDDDTEVGPTQFANTTGMAMSMRGVSGRRHVHFVALSCQTNRGTGYTGDRS